MSDDTPVKSRPRRLRMTLLILFCLIVGVFWLMFRAISPPDEITDVSAYSDILKNNQESPLLSHFPAAIPVNARHVRFVAFPGFLQGGAYVQLRMQLPADEIVSLDSRFKLIARHTYVGGDFFDHVNKDTHNVPTTTFRTADDPKNTLGFPNDYTLYVLYVRDPNGGWNHGATAGVAVSIEKSEVIYWADDW